MDPTEARSEPSTARKATQRSPRAPRTVRPKFHVEGLIPTRKASFDLKVPSIETLEAYAAFVGNRSGYTVSPSSILERLIEELERDKVFKAYREEAARTGRPIGAGAREVEG